MFDALQLFEPIRFTAETRPLQTADGEPVPEEMARAVHRTDTGQILSVVGSAFKPIQHADIIDPILAKFADDGIEVEERDPDKHSLYDLKGKKGAFGKVWTSRNGAVMRADFILGDFIEPTGPSSYLPSGPPTLFKRIRALNSHNSTYGVRVTFDYLNLVCLNGMVSSQFTTSTYGRHTKNFNTEGLRAKVGLGMEMLTGDVERFEQYIKTPLSREQAEMFCERTIAKLADKDGEPHWSQPKVTEIMGYFDREPQTVWGLYQAMTYWSTHGQLREGTDELTGRISRDVDVAKSLRSKEFVELLAA